MIQHALGEPCFIVQVHTRQHRFGRSYQSCSPNWRCSRAALLSPICVNQASGFRWRSSSRVRIARSSPSRNEASNFGSDKGGLSSFGLSSTGLGKNFAYFACWLARRMIVASDRSLSAPQYACTVSSVIFFGYTSPNCTNTALNPGKSSWCIEILLIRRRPPGELGCFGGAPIRMRLEVRRSPTPIAPSGIPVVLATLDARGGSEVIGELRELPIGVRFLGFCYRPPLGGQSKIGR